MKELFKLLYPLLAIIGLFSCETEQIMFDSSKNHVAFIQGSISIAEEGGTVGIPVMVAAMKGNPAITVDFTVDTAQSVAVLGTDFTVDNDPMSLSFPDGWGYDTIWVTPVDNDVFGGNISFVLRLTSNSLDYQFGAQDSIICTLVDNEHPLGTWIGTYDVAALSYGSPGAWDEAWTVTTSPDPDDVTKLIIVGVALGSEPFKAAIDLDAMSITITAGTVVGNGYGYGNVALWWGYPNSDLILDKNQDLVGEISLDGSIHIDNVGEELIDGPYAGYVWDVFDTYWTKSGKSEQNDAKQVYDKLRK
jgi:hypothetical protein